MAGSPSPRDDRGSTGRGSSAAVAGLLDTWLAELEQGRADQEACSSEHGVNEHAPSRNQDQSTGPLDERHTPDHYAQACRRVRVAGGVVTFTDEFGGRVALRQVDGVFQHAGSVGVRGPSAPVPTAFASPDLSVAAARAFEFVAAWAGSPFDHVGVDQATHTTLRWGFWDFSGEAIADVLARWKQGSAGSFSQVLGTYGVDVESPPAPAGASPDHTTAGPAAADAEAAAAGPAPFLLLRDDRGLVAERSGAERRIARDARWLAALARAGREPTAQRSQVAAALHRDVLPALAINWPGPQPRPVADVLRSPRDLAALLLVVLKLGHDRARRLVEAVAGSLGAAPSDARWLMAVRTKLLRAGHDRTAQDVLRIETSPELDQ